MRAKPVQSDLLDVPYISGTIMRPLDERGWWSSPELIAPASVVREARAVLKRATPADVQALLDVVNGERLAPDWLIAEMAERVRALITDRRAALHYCNYEAYPPAGCSLADSQLAALRASAWRGLRWVARTGVAAELLAPCADCGDYLIVTHKGRRFCDDACRFRAKRASSRL